MTENTVDPLSFSALRDLSKSAFRFWRQRVDPNRPPKKETDAKTFGKLFHVITLEPDQFDSQFATALDETLHPEALDTTEQMKTRIREINEAQGKKILLGGVRGELIERIRQNDETAVFMDDLKAEWNKANAGKTIVTAKNIQDAKYLAGYVHQNEDARALLTADTARRELRLEWVNKFGIPMRGIFDLFARVPGLGNVLVEIKTFSNPYEKSIDRIVVDKFANDMHFMQLAIYGEALREIYQFDPDWYITIFAETGDFPHVILRSNQKGSLAITQGEQMYEELCRKFLYYHDKFGLDTAWQDEAQRLRPFQDEEFPIWTFNNAN